MLNKAMERALAKGDCIDVNKILVEGDFSGDEFIVRNEGWERVYRISSFEEGMDYCDAQNERWIWSIGKRLSDGVIFSATDSRFYQDVNYYCLFLR